MSILVFGRVIAEEAVFEFCAVVLRFWLYTLRFLLTIPACRERSRMDSRLIFLGLFYPLNAARCTLTFFVFFVPFRG